MNLRFFKGEELTSYIGLWGKNLKATIDEIKVSPAIQSVLDIRSKFSSELGAYVRAAKVDTADKAMEIAHSFT